MNNSSGIKNRIYIYCKSKGIKIRDFERSCNMSNGYVSSIRTGLGLNKLNAVLRAYPDLNRDWLVYGEGSMLKDSYFNNNGIIGNNNKDCSIDNRQYYSDSPDVLRHRIDELDNIIAEKDLRIKEKDAQIKEKDAQIKEKDAQIKEKDAQINSLLEILKK